MVIILRDELRFYNTVIKKGISKGQLNTTKKKIKYIIRNILFFKHSKKIANFIMNHQYLKKEVYRYPVLCSKIHRPYISNFFNIDKKVKTILSSYQFLDNFFNENILKSLYQNGEIKICDVVGKDNNLYFIKLHLYTDFEKEGEFNLNCYDENNTLLTKLTFAFYNDTLIIGGLQGLEKETDQSLLKVATKNLYGIFPKKLIIEILYYLFPNCKKLAISNEGHIYLSTRYKFKKYRKINANYNEFWESFGGTPQENLWLLPKEIKRKNIEDVPSKKRSLYNNRFSLLDKTKEEIQDFIRNNCKIEKEAVTTL